MLLLYPLQHTVLYYADDTTLLILQKTQYVLEGQNSRRMLNQSKFWFKANLGTSLKWENKFEAITLIMNLLKAQSKKSIKLCIRNTFDQKLNWEGHVNIKP